MSRSHGLSATYPHEYDRWAGMKSRCQNRRHHAFGSYGGRGITVCARWRDFGPYFADTGPAPDGMSLDRNGNDKGYWCGKPECPECGPLGRKPNWRWASRSTQQRNTRATVTITRDGRTRSVPEWAELLGIPADLIYQRLRNNAADPLRPRRQPKRRTLSPRTQTYRIWYGMVQRCHNNRFPPYLYYGARGVRVCCRWRNADGYANFLSDMGDRPSPEHSLDRINPAGHYSPSNCRWTTKDVQYANRRKPRRRPASALTKHFVC